MTKEFLPPSGRTYLALRNQPRHMPRAFSEWVDNSFGEMRGNASVVKITIDGHTVTVLDDGQGPVKLGDVAQLGAGVSSGGYDAGRFGWGGSVSQLAFAERTHMYALRADGAVAHDIVDWDKVVEEQALYVDSGWDKKRVPAELRALDHGFMLRMQFRPKNINRDLIKEHLGKEFGAALRAGKRIEWRSGSGEYETIEPWSPGDLKDVVHGTYEFIDNPALEFEVEAGWSTSLAFTERGFDVEYGPRRICRDVAPLDGYRGATIYGRIKLIGEEWLDHLESEKGGIATEAYRIGVQERTRELIAPMMKKLQEKNQEEAVIDIAGDVAAAFGKMVKAATGTGGAGGTFPDTSAWKAVAGKKRKKRRKKKDEKPGEVQQRKIHMHLETDAFCGGRPWVADCPFDEDWDFALNKDIPAIAWAWETMPPDRPMVRQWIATAITIELVNNQLLVPLGLYSQEDFEKLEFESDEDALKMVPLVLRRVLDAVQSQAAA